MGTKSTMIIVMSFEFELTKHIWLSYWFLSFIFVWGLGISEKSMAKKIYLHGRTISFQKFK